MIPSLQGALSQALIWIQVYHTSERQANLQSARENMPGQGHFYCRTKSGACFAETNNKRSAENEPGSIRKKDQPNQFILYMASSEDPP
jgi:hypothetical protein